MENLFIFGIKSSGLVALFYLSYYFMLRKETFFNSNRWFLITGLITSVVLPLVVFTKIVWVNPSQQVLNWSKTAIPNPIKNEVFEINWFLVFGILYLIGFTVFLLKFAFDFYSLTKILNGKTIQQQADYKFITVTENLAPFSYFNYIVYNAALYSATELENILEHEKVHSAQNHTIDVLVSRLFCIAFWFNPFVWIYKKAIIQNLEYIADSEAIKNISDKKAYQLTLLKITTHENCVAITNHFYQSLIKKRIVMLNKNPSKKRNFWKYAIVFPALVAFVLLFQVKVVAQEKNPETEKTKSTPKAVTDKTTKNNISDKLISENKVNSPGDSITSETQIFINGSKATKSEMDKLDPNEIESVDVIKNSDKKSIRILTKNYAKTISENEIYIDDEKVNQKDLLELDQNSIEKMEVNKEGKNIRITTKRVNQLADNIDILTPPTPPTPPAFTLKSPKPLLFPRVPKVPKGDPINGDKKAWKEYESKMEDFNKKMDAMEPQIKAFDKKMEEFDKQMEPFNAAMDDFDKKMKIYEQQMEEYQSKINAKTGK